MSTEAKFDALWDLIEAEPKSQTTEEELLCRMYAERKGLNYDTMGAGQKAGITKLIRRNLKKL